MLLAGIWFSSDKPTMTTLLRPVTQAVNDLYQRGDEQLIYMSLKLIAHHLADIGPNA